MKLQNGTLDTRLPQNIIRNFEIPANVEHDKLNPFKIGGGNAIWATHLPPNVNVWFSTNPNFDNAQKLDYMNRGMRFMSIGSDGLQQQYDNFYIFTEGTWDDTIKIAVSSQGDMVEPILSSNTGDIENVGRVASILKMPVNGASGYNEPDFTLKAIGKYSAGFVIGDNYDNCQAVRLITDLTQFVKSNNYLFEIDAIVNNSNPYILGGDYLTNISSSLISFGLLKTRGINVVFEGNSTTQKYNKNVVGNIDFSNLKINNKYVNFYEVLEKDMFIPITLTNSFKDTLGTQNINITPKKVLYSGAQIEGYYPCILIQCRSNVFTGMFNFFVKIYSL